MVTGWDIYWITRLDYLEGIFFVLALLGGIIWFIAWFANGMARGEDPVESFVRYRKGLMFCGVLLMLGVITSTFVPNTKEAVAIYMIPPIVNNEDVREIPQNAAKLMNTKLQEWINENMVTKTEN